MEQRRERLCSRGISIGVVASCENIHFLIKGLKYLPLGAPESMDMFHEHAIAHLCSNSSPKMYSFPMFSISAFY